jgi:hypothetical protein
MFSGVHPSLPVRIITHLLNALPVNWMRGSLPPPLYAFSAWCIMDKSAWASRTNTLTMPFAAQVFHDQVSVAATLSWHRFRILAGKQRFSFSMVIIALSRYQVQLVAWKGPPGMYLIIVPFYSTHYHLIIRCSKAQYFQTHRTRHVIGWIVVLGFHSWFELWALLMMNILLSPAQAFGIIIRYRIRARQPRDRSSSLDSVKNCHFSMSSRPALGPTRSLIPWVPGCLSRG